MSPNSSFVRFRNIFSVNLICSGGSISYARPRSPPRSSIGNTRHTSSPTSRSGGKIASPPRQPYANILSPGPGGWNDKSDQDWGDEEEEEEEEIVYDDDEDEFGLPSISSIRKKGKELKPFQTQSSDPGGDPCGNPSNLGLRLGNGRQRANSSDIAEERGMPMYPTARKSEGKILRPQYKDILRGKGDFHFGTE